jgi:hypothetical protein
MSKNLPKNPTQTQRDLVNCAFDYYGEGVGIEEKKTAKMIALRLIGKGRGLPTMTKEQRDDISRIKHNFKDELYMSQVRASPLFYAKSP